MISSGGDGMHMYVVILDFGVPAAGNLCCLSLVKESAVTSAGTRMKNFNAFLWNNNSIQPKRRHPMIESPYLKVPVTSTLFALFVDVTVLLLP